MKFLQKREEQCHRNAGEDCKPGHGGKHKHHVHHTQCDHHQFEDGVQKKLTDTRRVMLNAQKEKRKFKFNQAEYRINRKVMVEKVSKLIHERIKEFMERILADDTHCEDQNHKHEDVKENSLLFKEHNFGMKKWNVEIPTSGFAHFMPFFSYTTREVKQQYQIE